jgi:hypothetical protein
MNGVALDQAQRQIPYRAPEASAERSRRHLRQHPLADELLEQLRGAEEDGTALRMGQQDTVPSPQKRSRNAGKSGRQRGAERALEQQAALAAQRQGAKLGVGELNRPRGRDLGSRDQLDVDRRCI